MTLKDKSKLESMIGKLWMFNTTTYKFTDLIELDDTIIISTDVKALSIQKDQVAEFIKQCLPATEPSEQKGLVIRGVSGDAFKELNDGLMASFREVQTASEEDLKTVVVRAQTKIKIAGSITNMARTVLEAQRLNNK